MIEKRLKARYFAQQHREVHTFPHDCDAEFDLKYKFELILSSGYDLKLNASQIGSNLLDIIASKYCNGGVTNHGLFEAKFSSQK
jgi:hypothetical protein